MRSSKATDTLGPQRQDGADRGAQAGRLSAGMEHQHQRRSPCRRIPSGLRPASHEDRLSGISPSAGPRRYQQHRHQQQHTEAIPGTCGNSASNPRGGIGARQDAPAWPAPRHASPHADARAASPWPTAAPQRQQGAYTRSGKHPGHRRFGCMAKPTPGPKTHECRPRNQAQSDSPAGWARILFICLCTQLFEYCIPNRRISPSTTSLATCKPRQQTPVKYLSHFLLFYSIPM
jgi:hypothetical protein